ncbi:hypothetical protein [Peribacillus kribbensis]|uniref:hypothetical protein n=1 Tax=Peribacillus kribbensis TaxID=356658 RepID=UPI00040A66E7|nr:hypothetical protein [Peribacillus kribbensis]
MNGMVTITHASSIKELNNKIANIKSRHELLNPHRKVIVKILNPDPNNVKFKDSEATSFAVSVDLLMKGKM